MGKYEGYLIATDFDGTFAGPGAVISRENSLAIRRFQAGGGLFTIASGRIPSFLAGYREDFVANAPLICTNGTVICDQNSLKILHCMTFGEEIDGFVRYLYERGDVNQLLVSGPDADKIWLEPRKVPFSPALLANVPKPWCRLLCVQSPERTLALRDEMLARFGDRYEFNRSWGEGLEVIPRGSGKGACLTWIRKYLGDRVHTTIGVGDYENDLTLIRDADVGCAVGNALDECKRVADRVIVPNTEHAIAAIIDSL